MFGKESLRREVLACFFLLLFFLALTAEEIRTPAEEANYTRYSLNEEITRFLSRLDYYSDELRVQIIGRTEKTENFSSRDLYLCLITSEGVDNPDKLNRDIPTFLLVASQHGNEQSAKEAALLLVRNLAVGELRPLLKKVNFLIIPQANPYGNRFNQRRNEQDLDLNRDHVKLESPEVRAIHHVFRTWMPEITMDVHEKGDDYYRISIGCVSNANIHPRLQAFSRNTILPEVENSLKEEQITFHEYLITQPMGIDSSAGVRYRREDVGEREMMKRYSTTDLNDGRNSLGIYQSFSFIQEGASRHDIETLRERTRWQYFGLRYFAESIARHGAEINGLVRDLRENLLERARVFSPEDVVHLRMKYARDKKQPTLAIKKFEQSENPIRGVLKVDKKAGDFITLADIKPYPYPSRFKVVAEVVRNWFPRVESIISVSRPLGYIIPAKYLDIVETLLQHGLKVDVFTSDTVLEVEAYLVTDIIPAKYDYLSPEIIQVDKKDLRIIIRKGGWYISTDQEGSSLIPCLLEPQSQYGLIRYWKYNLVPERGDIFPFYRVAKKADLLLIPYKKWKR